MPASKNGVWQGQLSLAGQLSLWALISSSVKWGYHARAPLLVGYGTLIRECTWQHIKLGKEP